MPTLRPEEVPAMVDNGFLLKLDVDIPPRFKPGDKVRTRNIHPRGHTRLPRYARGKVGTVIRDHGVYPLPDTNAHGNPKPQHVYMVRFAARELWGADAPAADTLHLDLWDDHLELEP